MLAIVLIPGAALLIIGVGGAGYLVHQGYTAQQWATTTAQSSVVDAGNAFTALLGEERRLSLLRLGDPSVAGQLTAERNQVNSALVQLRTYGVQFVKSNPGALKDADTVLVKLLGQLQQLRQGIDAGRASVQDVYNFYNQLIDIMSLSLQGIAKTAPDPVTAVEGTVTMDMFNVAEAMSRANALALGGVVANEMNDQNYQEFSRQVGYYHNELDLVTPRLTKPEQDTFAGLVASPDWHAVTTMENFLLLRGPQRSAAGSGGALPMSVQDWQNASARVHSQLLNLYSGHYRYAAQFAADTGHRTFVDSLIGGGLILLIAIVAAFVATRLSNRVVRRLKDLRAKTLELAETRLPQTVIRLRSGEHINIDDEVPSLHYGNDEIGQVAEAFNKAQHTAVAAAAQEARTREGVNAVFLNIAHRSQIVVHRQLEVLDRAERSEEDPDELELLFQLDHLATRARRNAENLIILGGQRPGRKWRNPVPLVEIVRSAVGETEQYQRVNTGRLPDVSVAGAVVADLVHLLAELIDNATSFSPQDSRVEVRGNMVGKGVVVEVEDQGLGILEEDLEQINNLLHEPPDFGVMALGEDSRLGLFVVSQLAAQHGISVTLVESVYGGIRAIVLVRASLLARDTTGGEPGNNSPAPAGDPAATTDTMELPIPRQVLSRPQIPDAVPISEPVPAAKLAQDTEVTVGWPTDESAADELPAYGISNGDSAPFQPFQPFQPQTGRHSLQPGGPQPGGMLDDEPPPLPRRRRQASLAPQLVGEVSPLPEAGEPSDADAVRTAELARDTMAAFQQGSRRGRTAI